MCGKDRMQHIFDTIEKYHMIEEGMHIIAGVSGGADSVCLLLALCEYRRRVAFTLGAVHVEHGIRGGESLGDAAFVEELCRSLSVPLFVRHIDVPQLARKRGTSLEETAREERYRIFAEQAQKEAYRSRAGQAQEEAYRDFAGQAHTEPYRSFAERKQQTRPVRIAVAHNRGDQAETVLWNLVRGSGLDGLCGMHPVRGNIIRPLLFTDREEIEKILRDAGLSWRTDATNLETEYTRNKIRLSVVPLLEKELNPQAAAHIAGVSGQLRQVQEYVKGQVHKASERCLAGNGCEVQLLLAPFFEEEELIRAELIKAALERCCGSRRDIGSIHIEAVRALCEKDCGRGLDLPYGVKAVRQDGIVKFSRTSQKEKGVLRQAEPITLPVCGRITAAGFRIRTEVLENCEEIMAQAVQEKKYTKWFSYDIIKSNVVLRTRQTGDYLTVGAECGRKKLKDYFIDCKIPREDRDAQLLLADGPHILWVVGARISEAAKVRPETEKVLKIQLEEIAG